MKSIFYSIVVNMRFMKEKVNKFNIEYVVVILYICLIVYVINNSMIIV